MAEAENGHNAEAAEVWAAFHAGKPIRPPVYLGTATQYFIFNGEERILGSGVCHGGRFILREGNNLAPHTPVRNLAAMYEAARAHTGLSRC